MAQTRTFSTVGGTTLYPKTVAESVFVDSTGKTLATKLAELDASGANLSDEQKEALTFIINNQDVLESVAAITSANTTTGAITLNNKTIYCLTADERNQLTTLLNLGISINGNTLTVGGKSFDLSAVAVSETFTYGAPTITCVYNTVTSSTTLLKIKTLTVTQVRTSSTKGTSTTLTYNLIANSARQSGYDSLISDGGSMNISLAATSGAGVSMTDSTLGTLSFEANGNAINAMVYLNVTLNGKDSSASATVTRPAADSSSSDTTTGTYSTGLITVSGVANQENATANAVVNHLFDDSSDAYMLCEITVPKDSSDAIKTNVWPHIPLAMKTYSGDTTYFNSICPCFYYSGGTYYWSVINFGDMSTASNAISTAKTAEATSLKLAIVKENGSFYAKVSDSKATTALTPLASAKADGLIVAESTAPNMAGVPTTGSGCYYTYKQKVVIGSKDVPSSFWTDGITD